MINDAVTDALLDKAAKQLAARLAKFSTGVVLTEALLRDVHDLVRNHRRECSNNLGLKFPKMVPVVLPSVGQIMLHNAELDERSIQAIVINISTNYPQVPLMELAQAIKRAYPYYRPNGINFAPSTRILQ